MAIKPPSDLVLDVARAADPLEYQASIEKLRNAQSAVRSNKNTNELNINDFAKLANTQNGNISAALNRPLNALKFSTQGSKTEEAVAYKKFEAFMLQNFIDNMFTTDTPSVFGEGLAGKYWKSMMTEQIANQMAENGGIGVAKMLENDKLRKEASLGNEMQMSAQQGAVRGLAGDGTNKQATIDNIIHDHERDFVRQYKNKIL